MTDPQVKENGHDSPRLAWCLVVEQILNEEAPGEDEGTSSPTSAPLLEERETLPRVGQKSRSLEKSERQGSGVSSVLM